jgi:hypothetical protein
MIEHQQTSPNFSLLTKIALGLGVHDTHKVLPNVHAPVEVK